MNTRQVVQIGLLSAAAMVLHVTETWLSLPAPVPGIKLGLANCAALLALHWYGLKAACYITVIRVLLGALLGGSFLGPAFVLSASGGIGSVLIMGYACRRWQPPFSVIGVSIIGAASHSALQVAAAAVLVGSISLLWYLPYVVLLAIPAGSATGVTAHYFRRYMPR